MPCGRVVTWAVCDAAANAECTRLRDAEERLRLECEGVKAEAAAAREEVDRMTSLRDGAELSLHGRVRAL